MINLYLVVLIVIGSFILAFLVLLNNKKNILNQLFFIFALMNTIWALVNLMTGIFPNEIWVRGMYGTGALIVASGLIWFFYLLDNKVKLAKYIFINSLGLLFFILSLFTKLIVKRIDVIYFGYFEGEFGNLFFLYTLFLASSLTYIVFRLFRTAFMSLGMRRLQLFYVAIGAAIFAFTAVILSFILPILDILFFSQFDLVGSFIFLLFIAYSVVKYRLMDIRLVITKSILYFVLVLSVALAFTFVTFLTAQFFQGEGQVWVTLIVSLIIVMGLDPLKKLLAKLTDKFFYKRKIDYQKVLRDISEIIAREIELENLLQSLEFNLQNKLKVKTVKTYLLTNTVEPVFEFKNDLERDKIKKDNIIIEYLKKKKEVIVTEEIARFKSDAKADEDKKEFEELENVLDAKQASLAVPIISEGELTGLFLIGSKLSGGVFTQADLDFFEVLGPQTATALEKSKLYEEVQEFNISLQDKVKQATFDLEERNRYLIALQKLTNVITRSLDFENVMQTIANGITHQLGFVGGLLNFVDFEKKEISIGAISNTPEIKSVIQFLPQDPKTYTVSLNDEDNYAVKAIKTKELQITNNFWDFVKPALSEDLALKIQEALGIKCVVAVPVYSEERVIGVIDFVLAKDSKKITNIEKEMMYALSDQVGIVYRNLTYYEKIQTANQDLKNANIRLHKLDKAKSEFLSIASHQLRTPLTGIKGYLSMIAEGDFGEVPPKISKVIDEIFINSDRLTRLVNVFLNVSRIESGRFTIEKENIDLIKLVEDVVNEFIPNAKKKNLKLSFKKSKKLIPEVSMDKDKIKDVVINMVDNSIKYTPEGSINVYVEQRGNQIIVSVKDTGVGIMKSEAKELFKKFVRGVGIAQVDTSGSGLGLYIAKKIIEAHSGEIWAESEGKGKGATFSFSLPLK